MAHHYSQTGYSGADAYSPPLSSFATPIPASHQHTGGTAAIRYPVVEDDDNNSSEGEWIISKNKGKVTLLILPWVDWNVYDDFNNKRPLSTAVLNQSSSYQTVQEGDRQEEGYNGYQDDFKHRIRDPVSRATKQQNRQTLIPSGAFGFDARNGDVKAIRPEDNSTNPYMDSTELLRDDGKDASGIELVTVPALGAEFTNEEVRAMKKPYKRRRKARTAGTNARRWVKSDDRYLGCFSPPAAIFFIFTLLARWETR